MPAQAAEPFLLGVLQPVVLTHAGEPVSESVISAERILYTVPVLCILYTKPVLTVSKRHTGL